MSDQYVRIGIVTFTPNDVSELEAMVESALRKEQKMWGASHVVICRSDPSLASIERQFRAQKFAGMSWKSSVDEVVAECTHLLVVGSRAKHYKKFMKWTALPNIKRRRYLDRF